ncbi:hypothetical protein HQ560_19110 [bacterium]|nr:hypothetical protein [bacterium]
MNRLTVALSTLALVVAVLVLTLSGSRAQEVEQRTQLVAALDITPIQVEIQAVRAEVAALRALLADENGLRADIAKASAATKAMGEQVEALATRFTEFADATQPVIEALKPPARWEYKVLKAKSDSVANRYAREGWELLTAGGDWLYFRKPVRD